MTTEEEKRLLTIVENLAKIVEETVEQNKELKERIELLEYNNIRRF